MAKKTVVRESNGEAVTLELWRVDRQRRRVGIDIPAYNARLIFTQVGTKVGIIQDSDRQHLDPSKLATLHVSQTVYRELVKWAASILGAKR